MCPGGNCGSRSWAGRHGTRPPTHAPSEASRRPQDCSAVTKPGRAARARPYRRRARPARPAAASMLPSRHSAWALPGSTSRASPHSRCACAASPPRHSLWAQVKSRRAAAAAPAAGTGCRLAAATPPRNSARAEPACPKDSSSWAQLPRARHRPSERSASARSAPPAPAAVTPPKQAAAAA